MHEELLKIETYNQNGNVKHTAVRRIIIECPKPGNGEPSVFVLCEDEISGDIVGDTANAVVQVSLPANNTMRVPVMRKNEAGELEPVIAAPAQGVEGEEGYTPPVYATIGEFDLWSAGIWEQAIKPHVEKAIKQKKGLLPHEPLMLILPDEGGGN